MKKSLTLLLGYLFLTACVGHETNLQIRQEERQTELPLHLCPAGSDYGHRVEKRNFQVQWWDPWKRQESKGTFLCPHGRKGQDSRLVWKIHFGLCQNGSRMRKVGYEYFSETQGRFCFWRQHKDRGLGKAVQYHYGEGNACRIILKIFDYPYPQQWLSSFQ